MRRCVKCSVNSEGIMAELDKGELKQVKELLVTQEYKAGEVLFFQGDKMHGCYFLNEGKVKLYKSSFSGENQILNIIKPGEIIGLCALRDKENYGHTAEVMEDVAVCYLNRDKLDNLFQINPELSQKFFSTLLNEINRAYQQLYILGTKNAKEKVANFLLSTATGDNKDLKNGIKLSLSISRDDIAQMLGISTETVIRVISKFKEKDIIAGQGKNLIIKDIAKLEKISK